MRSVSSDDPQAVDGFWANAIVRHDKVPREVDFERAAKTTWAKLLNAPIPMRGERASGWCVSTRQRRLRPRCRSDGADGRPLAQIQAMFFAPVTEGGKVVDFFQIIGTCLRNDSLQTNMDQIPAMIASFRFL